MVNPTGKQQRIVQEEEQSWMRQGWKLLVVAMVLLSGQWAVNMYQGEIFGYAHFLQSQKMFPAGVNFFWEDIVCKYWKWAGKVGGSEMTMKPALSVMHAKAHKWSCQVSPFYKFDACNYALQNGNVCVL